MGLKELREKMAALKVEVRSLIATDIAADVATAETKMTEVRALDKKINLLVELGKEEERSLLDQKEEKEKKVKVVSEMRSITKKLMGKELSVEERAAIMSADNAVLIPKQLIMQVIELSTGYGSLKGICDVIPVVKNEGTIPVVDITGQNARSEERV